MASVSAFTEEFMQKGDVFVVCDAGGGTVVSRVAQPMPMLATNHTQDLVSYEVLSVEPMRVKEFVKGEGGMCGAIFIDEQFEAQVKRTLGKRWTQMSPASRKRVVDSQWENGIKRNFDGSDEEWTVALPADVFSRKDILLRRDSVRGEVPVKNGQLIIKSYVRFNCLVGILSGTNMHCIGVISNSGSRGSFNQQAT